MNRPSSSSAKKGKTNKFKNVDKTIKSEDVKQIKGASILDGHFSQINHCELHGNRLVMKTYKDKAQYEVEKEFYLHYKHKNILELQRHCDELLVLLLPYMPKTLQNVLESLNWEDTKKVLIQSVEALHYIHQKGFIYMDFKPTNVLLDQENNVHICDFGALVRQNEDATVGTVDYFAPEVTKRGAKATTDLDIYSFGLVMIQLLKRCTVAEAKQIVRRAAGKTRYEPLVHPSFNGCKKESAAKITDLAHRCTHETPGRRANIEEIMEVLQQL